MNESGISIEKSKLGSPYRRQAPIVIGYTGDGTKRNDTLHPLEQPCTKNCITGYTGHIPNSKGQVGKTG